MEPFRAVLMEGLTRNYFEFGPAVQQISFKDCFFVFKVLVAILLSRVEPFGQF